MNSSSGTNTKYFQFQLGGTNLANYVGLKLYFQTQRSSSGATVITVAYSSNGTSYTNLSSTVSVSSSWGEKTVDLSNVTALSGASSIYIRLLASGASGSGTLRLDNFQVQGNAPATVTTGDPAGTPVCASGSSTISVPYSVASGSTISSYSVLLSDASGSFTSGTTTLSTSSTSSPLVVTIPKTVAGGTGYLVKAVVGGNIASANAMAFTINNVSIAPTAAQSVAINTNGTRLDATENGGTVTSRQWYYSTTSGSGYTNAISGATGTSYTPNFPTAGTYYVVVQTTFPASGGGTCTVASNEVAVTVTNPTITTTGPASPNNVYCAVGAPAAISVSFTTSAPFAAGTTFSVQLSSSSGSFSSGATIIGTGTTSPIAASLPAGTNGTNYLVRVISTSPPVNGTSKSITVYGTQTASVSPTADQTISKNGGSGARLTVSETPTADSRQWAYSTMAGGPYTDLGGQTTVNYTPSAADFGGTVGTYYVVAKSALSACGTTVTSNEVKVTVVDTRIVVAPTSLTGFITPAGTASSAQTYTLQGYDLLSNVTVLTPTGTNYEVAYSVGTTPGTPGTYSAGSSSLTIPRADAQAGVTVYVRLRSAAAAGSYTGTITNSSTGSLAQNVAVSGTVTSLTVSTAALAAFSTTAGTPSVSRSFTVTGSNLTDPVTVTAPGGYEVSLTDAVGSYATTQTIAPASGSVSGTVYVRLTDAAGTFSGNVVVSSPNASTRNVAVTGTAVVIAAEPTAQPTVTVSNVGFTQADITIGGGDGQKRLVVIRTSGATNALPVDNTTYTPSVVYSSGSTTGTSNYVLVADASTTTFTVTGLSTVQGYVVSVYAYNDNNTTNQENYLTATPGTASFTTIATPSTYYAKATGDLNQLATYGFNPDGSGQSPTNFTTTGRTFTVSGTGRTIGAAWTVSGTNSKVVLAANASFIVPAASGVTFTGTLEQGANSTLVIQNTTFSGIRAGTQDASSTIDFAQAGTVTLPSTTTLPVRNLKLTNGTKVFAINPSSSTSGTVIPGNLTLDGATVYGASSGQFSTVELSGSLTLLNAATFSNAAASRITLVLNGSGTQTLAGNGSVIRLFRLRTGPGNNRVVLSDANGGTPVEVGSPNGGGIELYTGSTLVLNANTLSSYPGGRAVFSKESTSYGTLTLSAASSLVVDSQAPVVGFLVPDPAASTMGNLTITTFSGDALEVYGSDLTVAGTLTLTDAGSGIWFPGQALTLNGPLVGPGVIYGDANGSLTIGGTGALVPLTFGDGYQQLRNLTLNRAGTATLGSPLVIGGTLTLTTGIMTTTTTNSLTLTAAATTSGGSAGSFVNGPLHRVVPPVSSGAFYTFPIGKGTAYRPLTLNVNTQSNTITYRAEQVEGNPGQAGTDPAANDGSTLTRVSRVRSFRLTPFVGSTVTQPSGFAGTVTLSYEADDRVTTLAGLVVGKRADSGQPWANAGVSGGTSSGSGFGSGTLTSGSLSSFSDFALASTSPDPSANPLPVELTAFAAQRTTRGEVSLTWATASEKNSAHFEVERSLDGRTFAAMTRVQAAGSGAQARTYTSRDANAPASLLYYRLRLVDQDGTATYSPIATVAAGPADELTLTPNPTHDQLRLLTGQASAYAVRSPLGQVVLTGTTTAGTFTTLDVAGLPSGVYFFELRGETGRVVRKFVKE